MFIIIIINKGGWPAFVDTVLHEPFSPPTNGPVFRVLATILLGYVFVQTYLGRVMVSGLPQRHRNTQTVRGRSHGTTL